MPEIRHALVTLPWQGEALDRIKRALAPAEVVCAHRFDVPRISRALRQADVAILAGDLDDRVLQAPLLKWVHCGHAGLDRSARPEVFERGLLLTSAAGRSAPALAEHAMFFMLALSFRYGHLYKAQLAHRWGVSGQGGLSALYGKTLGIVGLGHTGVELAKRAKAFGMRVLAYRRRPDAVQEVDRLYSADRGEPLGGLLEESDYVVLALPLSDQTNRLIGAGELAHMRPGAHLVNIARGGLVDEQALLDALQSGRLAGAAIDVAEHEPLPSDHPLWDAPNLLITPHVTPQMPDRDGRALDILLENIRRYREGEQLLNQLMPDDQFSQQPGPGAAKSAGAGFVYRSNRFARRLLHRWRTR